MALPDALEWLALLAGFALLHSLWQTSVAALLVGGMRRLGGRVPPQIRYGAALTLLLSLPALALTTAILLASSRDDGEAIAWSAANASPAAPWVGAAAPWIGWIWALGVGAMVLRLLSGLVWSARLVGDGREAEEALSERMRWCGQRLGLRAAVSIVESERVKVPSVVGLWRPAIVVPTGFFSALDPEEVDAIIAHELSHVRRRDLWFHAAERVVAALLFFHPAARYLTRMIGRDREICCDDLVARSGVCRRVYARALAKVALSNQPSVALGLGAAEGDVVERVRRLIVPRDDRADMLKPWSGLAVLSLLLGTTALGTQALIPATARLASTAPAWEARVLADDPTSYTTNALDPAGAFTLSWDEGRVTGATVDGRPLEAADIRQRGARVTLLARSPARAFAIQLFPGGRIEWPARAPQQRD